MPWAMKEIMVAKHWNLMPWEFRSLAPEYKAELMAAFFIEREMDGYYKSESMKRFDSKMKEAKPAKHQPRKW